MNPEQPASSRLADDATQDERRSAREEPHRRLRPGAVRALGHPEDQSQPAQRTFLLQRAQPALSGLIDGSLSSLAPIFSVALATHTPRYAFYAGLATAIGAGVSMSFSEGLSDTGEDTGRGNPRVRGAIGRALQMAAAWPVSGPEVGALAIRAREARQGPARLTSRAV
jgi:hypothetical protein